MTHSPLKSFLLVIVLSVLLFVGQNGAVFAAKAGVGPVTNLPLPRFASLKSDRINLREGPSKEHKTVWIYQRAGLPVEITAEFENWRRIRDSEGTEGWVFHSMLSGKRMALAAPWQKEGTLQLLAKPDPNGSIVAVVQPGVQMNVKRCDGTWCRVNGDGYDGYIKQDMMWGAYAGEPVE